jgi:P4 family phage/plasmid primase-like protien
MSTTSIAYSATRASLTDQFKANPSTAPRNDLHAGRMIADHARNNSLHVTYLATSKSSGDWYVWNGRVHEKSQLEVDDHLVTAFVDALTEAVDNLSSVNAKDERIQHLERLCRGWSSTGGIEKLKTRVRAELREHPDYFAANRDFVVMQNGWVYDIDDPDTAHAPDRSRPVTKCLGVSLPVGPDTSLGDLAAAYGGGGMWQAWLDEFVPLTEDQDFLQEAMGAALFGQGKARNIVHLVGPPGTGKSTVQNLGERAFGSYAGTLAKEAITKQTGSNFHQIGAKDVRFLHLSEPDTDRVDGSFLKNLAGGGESITSDVKNRDPVTWKPECVPFIAANSIINFATWDQAIVDRVNIVHFNTKVKHIDHSFEDRLFATDGPAILAWILEGAVRYLNRGHIFVPQVIKDRAQANVVENSNVLRWLEDQTQYKVVRDNSAFLSDCVLVSEAWSDYVIWCGSEFETPISKRRFVDDIHRFTNRPHDAPKRSNGTRLYGVTPNLPAVPGVSVLSTAV